MNQQIPVHKRLKENAMKFDSLLAELDGMKFMSMKTKHFYEITGYQNSLRTDISLELYNSQAEFAADEFLYVTLQDSAVETAIVAIYEQGLVPVVVIPAQEETKNDESEEEPSDPFRDILEIFNRMKRGQ